MSKLKARIGKGAKGSSGILGVDKFVDRLHQSLQKKKAASAQGLIHAAAFVRREMETTPPLIPVDTGNLRASWYARLNSQRDSIGIGFTASYAAVVHERDWRRGKRPAAVLSFLYLL
jgi:hypothetical protein